LPAQVDLGSATCSKVPKWLQRQFPLCTTLLLADNIANGTSATPTPPRAALRRLANIYAFSVEAPFRWPPYKGRPGEHPISSACLKIEPSVKRDLPAGIWLGERNCIMASVVQYSSHHGDKFPATGLPRALPNEYKSSGTRYIKAKASLVIQTGSLTGRAGTTGLSTFLLRVFGNTTPA